ncbi:MAG: sugar phosphate nucleotidyltransferase, partial [Candidatus Bipolaricaulaceae bacterium]
METFRYPIILYSQDGTRSFRVEALVDTGATYTWVPRPTLEALGHKAAFRRRLRLADGRVIEREGCEVQVEIDGARLTTPVIFGDPGSEVLLGAVTLEQFSLAPDPVTRRLVPVEALLMGVHPGGSCPKAVKRPEDLKGVSGTISAASPLGTGERKMGGVFAVIMAGGRGERLWPLSTPKKPKQFLKLLGRNTLLQETAARISGLIPKENIYVVTPKEFTKLVLEQLDLPKKNIVVEPVGRSTAPCVGLAAVMLESQDPQGVMVVLPADHVIKKTEEFLEVLKRAIEVASSGAHLVTLGIVPDHPATGYGYIRCGELFTKMGGVDVYKVQKFTEKPDEKAVKRFVEEGGYYW